jgi:HEAT repeat protein
MTTRRLILPVCALLAAGSCAAPRGPANARPAPAETIRDAGEEFAPWGSPEAIAEAAALRGRARKQPAGREEMLLAAMRSPHAAVRVTAAGLLDEKSSPRLMRALVTLCTDPDPLVRDPAAKRLESVFGKAHAEAVPECVALTKCRWPQARASAMLALLSTEDPRALESAVRAAASDSDAHVRAHALLVLGKLGGPRAEAAALRAVREPGAHAWSLGYGMRALEDMKALGALRKLADDANAGLRRLAAVKLLKLAPQEGIPLVRALVADQSLSVKSRRRWADMLAAAGWKGAPPELPELVTRNVKTPPPPGGCPPGYARPRAWTPRLCAVDLGAGRVYLGWSVEDRADRSYRLERSADGESWEELCVTGAGSHLDSAPVGQKALYRVANRDRTVSPAQTVTPSAEGIRPAGLALAVSNDRAPVAAHAPPPVRAACPALFRTSLELALGDLDGDGRLDYVVSEIASRSRRAYSSSGRLLWRRPYHWGDTWGHPVKTVVADLDGDGRSEAATFEEDGDRKWLVLLDGATGRVLRHVDAARFLTGPWERRDKLLAVDRSGCGRPDTVVLARNSYGAVRAAAFDARLRHLWTASSRQSKAHKSQVVDLDGDGRDEIVLGGACLDARGRTVWNLPELVGGGHADYIEAMEIDPARPGLELAFAGCNNDCTWMTDWTGRLVWLRQTGHAQWLVAGRFGKDPGGHELWVRRKDSKNPDRRLSIGGEHLGEPPRRGASCRIDWDGEAGNGDEVFCGDGTVFHPASGRVLFRAPGGQLLRVADVLGDSREEIIVVSADRRRIEVYTNATVNPRPRPDRWDTGYWRYRSPEKKPFGRIYRNPPS